MFSLNSRFPSFGLRLVRQNLLLLEGVEGWKGAQIVFASSSKGAEGSEKHFHNRSAYEQQKIGIVQFSDLEECLKQLHCGKKLNLQSMRKFLRHGILAKVSRAQQFFHYLCAEPKKRNWNTFERGENVSAQHTCALKHTPSGRRENICSKPKDQSAKASRNVFSWKSVSMTLWAPAIHFISSITDCPAGAIINRSSEAEKGGRKCDGKLFSFRFVRSRALCVKNCFCENCGDFRRCGKAGKSAWEVSRQVKCKFKLRTQHDTLADFLISFASSSKLRLDLWLIAKENFDAIHAQLQSLRLRAQFNDEGALADKKNE